jgi:transcriptional regulator with XRE-family HTH domain
MGENGERLSPEALGSRLGVSGATIRRWETGQSNPNEEDLGRLADVCRLSEQQGEFLLRLFARGTLRTPGAPKHFRDHARRFLAPQKCACLVDELLFIRAWTGDFAAHAGELASELPGGLNAVELALFVGRRSEPELEALRVRALVRQMWMWTAQFAAFPAYTNLVRRLLKYDSFAANWNAIVEEDGDDVTPPLTMPVLEGETDEGAFTLYTAEILFPPLYRIFICEQASAQEPGAASELSEVHFAHRLHWSE